MGRRGWTAHTGPPLPSSPLSQSNHKHTIQNITNDCLAILSSHSSVKQLIERVHRTSYILGWHGTCADVNI